MDLCSHTTDKLPPQNKAELKVFEILTRLYVQDIQATINFYENLLNEKCRLRFQYKETDLELAQVGTLLILAGSEKALQPFKATKATFIVNSVEAFKEFLLKNGAIVVRDIKHVPTGKNMTFKHADGTVVEYVEYTKA